MTRASWWIVWRWLVSRALVALLLWYTYGTVTGDLRYYFQKASELLSGAVGWGETLKEYPPSSVLLTTGLKLVSGSNQQAYAAAFIVFMVGVDIWFTWLLWRGAGRRPGTGVFVWVWFAPALGPIMYSRLDLLPAALAGAAVIVMLRSYAPGSRPVVAGVLAGLGFVVKLFPLIVLPALWLRREGRWRLVAGFAGTAVAGIGIGWLLLGADRTLSPLTWQRGRGLQIESLFALPVLVANVFDRGRWTSAQSQYVAIEVFGPWVGTLLTAATVATVLAVALLAVLWVRGLLGRQPSAATIAWMVIVTICLMLLTNKVFSPQYLVWLAAALAALGAVAADGSRTVRFASWLFLALCALTQLIFPILYDRLIFALETDMVVLLLIRDALLVALTVLAIHQVWVGTGGSVRERVEVMASH
ncbi:glycosyltransferase 87 family protein [Flindersiella endophytica]